jgi:hypothetical protein
VEALDVAVEVAGLAEVAVAVRALVGAAALVHGRDVRLDRLHILEGVAAVLARVVPAAFMCGLHVAVECADAAKLLVAVVALAKCRLHT